MSGVIALLPTALVGNIPLALTFVSTDVGHTLSFTLTIHWGTSADFLPFQSHRVSNLGIEDFDEDNTANGSIVVVP